MKVILSAVTIGLIAFIATQSTFAEENGSAKVDAKLTSAKTKHPGGSFVGDGADGVGYTYDHGMEPGGFYGSPDVGYNYYGQPGTGVATASLYPAPYPTPAIAGHTMYTYQPLMPHEHLYRHKRVYYTPYAAESAFYNDPYARHSQGIGYNKTTVHWQSGHQHFAPGPAGIYALHDLQAKMYRMKYRLAKIGCSPPPAGISSRFGGRCQSGNCK